MICTHHHSLTGRRVTNQDRHNILIGDDIGIKTNIRALIGMYDGHGDAKNGHDVAEYLRKMYQGIYLHFNILQTIL